MSLIERAPERYTLWVCQDCAQPAHGPGSRCPRDKRRTWTQMGEVEYVRADLNAGAVAENEKLRLQVAALENDGMELAARLGEAEEQIARLAASGGQ
jgi:hypothetical protein